MPAQNRLTHRPGQKTEARGQVAAGNEHGCGDVKSTIRCSITYQINIFYDLFSSPGPSVKTRGKAREGFEESDACDEVSVRDPNPGHPGQARARPLV